MAEAFNVARDLWQTSGLPVNFLDRHLKLRGDPVAAINSSFKIGVLAQATIGISGLAAAYLHYLRTGVEQDVSVDARHAVLEFKSEIYYTLNNQAPAEVWDTIAGVYATKDSSFVRIHTNFPHHRKGVLDILNLPGCDEISREEIASAILQWNAEDLEEVAAKRGMSVVAYRSFELWDRHPQAKSLKGKLPVTVTRVNDGIPERDYATKEVVNQPLQGTRVLELTRVLAGPIAGRTLAAHGANVLLITSPTLPALPALDADTSRGKRTARLDLTAPTDKKKLMELTSEADVFLQAYRPGALENKGFGVDDLVKIKSAAHNNSESKKGIVCANLCAWGWEGPWKDRRGFDSMVQTATGFNRAEAEAYHTHLHPNLPIPKDLGSLKPKPFPMQTLDHAAAYFLAFGTITALCKRITCGGSYEVRVSLAGVAQCLRLLGRIPPSQAFEQGHNKELPPRMATLHPEVANFVKDLKVSKVSRELKMVALQHAAILSRTPVVESEAPVVLNAHDPTW